MLGLWLPPHEGAKFWLRVVTVLKHREMLEIACVDGLKGFPEAIEAVFPATTAKWDADHPPMGQSWRRQWERLPLLQLPAEIRKVIYTTNAFESVND